MNSLPASLPIVAVFVSCLLPAPVRSDDHGSGSKLLIDPLLIAEAAEVWSVVATDDNEVWPGWNAASTPLLFYLPDKQDVLINHPNPPEGFVPYTGPIRFPGGNIALRNGETFIKWDGQNTSRTIGDVKTLVVADTLSNRKMDLKALIEDSRPAREKLAELTYDQLGNDPYDALGLIAHEAFHVYQFRKAPGKGGNEGSLRTYPVLSVPNNVGFALEGAALASALRASGPEETRAAAVRWMAIRRDRRSQLSRESIEYEDGTEFNEGLAKYVEYRLTEVLEGRKPGPAMKWLQGFEGYEDLSGVRERLIDQMVAHMRGEVNVNNDPYGTSPLRMRLYYSGMAIAALLDKLSLDWHHKILKGGTTLTHLARKALKAKRSELADGLAKAKSGAEYDAIVETKQQLEADGKVRIREMLAAISDAPGGSITLDYSAPGKPRIGMSFTPFGIVSVDSDRTIYQMMPIKARMGAGYSFAQTEAAPVLHDKKRGYFQFALPETVSRARLAQALGRDGLPVETVADLDLELPGAVVSAKYARLVWEAGDVTISFLLSESP